MKKKVKIIVSAALAVVVVAAVVVSMLKPLEVEAVTLAPDTAQLTFTEQGYYDYTGAFQVYPLVAGEVLEVLVQKGDYVSAGDLIAVVSASDYEYQIAQLRSTVSGYNAQISNLALQEQQEKDILQGTLQELQGQLTTLEAQMENEDPLDESRHQQASLQQSIVRQYRKMVEELEDELDWIEDLYDEGEVSFAEYTAAQQALANAKSSYYAAQVTLEQLRSGGTPEGVYEGQKQSLQAQIDSVASRLQSSYSSAMAQYYNAQIESTNSMIAQMEEKAGQASITAPVSGTINSLPIEDANIISQQSLVAQIGYEAFVEVYVSTREIDGVHKGDAVELLIDKRLGTESIPGTVVLVEDKAEVKYSALGVEERKVRVLIQPQGGGLLIGHEMDVRFTVYTQEDALVVPKTAVFQQDGGDCVWVIRDGAAQVQPVTKGVETREGYVVEEGLLPGDQVVRDANNSGLSEGKRATGGPTA